MVRYILKQNKNSLSPIYGKWFAYPVIEETINLDGLAEHMSSHNTPYSEGVIKGLLTDMISCIKELLLDGKNVKIDDLAIFSLGIKNSKGGSATEEEFSVTKNINGVKLRARATGTLVAKSLNLDATLKKATATSGSSSSNASNASNSGSTTPSNGGNTTPPSGSNDDPGEGD